MGCGLLPGRMGLLMPVTPVALTGCGPPCPRYPMYEPDEERLADEPAEDGVCLPPLNDEEFSGLPVFV